MELGSGHSVWQFGTEIRYGYFAYGNCIWKLGMEIWYGNWVWKLHMYILYGNLAWGMLASDWGNAGLQMGIRAPAGKLGQAQDKLAR